MKKQVIIIHGGDTFGTYSEYLNFLSNYQIDVERYKRNIDDWKVWLRNKLGEGYEVMLPMMPNKNNARYEEWKLWMDKLLPFIQDDVILIGHSMGGSFLAKYLSENKFPKKIKSVFLVSAVFDNDDEGYSLQSFSLPENLNLQTDKVYLYHSQDDKVVPFKSLDQFKSKIPDAVTRVFSDRGHINQEIFPEIVEDPALMLLA
ncbi:MAG: alpha/beta fold hydrolase [Candidatus Nealsonbacteria bacterium]|nr:alpha/beta fold hydrolase [Candidatus Nealsonbacteria bacterium]